MEGFYAIYFTGAAGSGFGLLIFQGGKITGVDAMGGKFDGDYRSEPGGDISASLSLIVPAGVPLATGAPPSSQSYSLPLSVRLPSDFALRPHITIQTPTGPVNVVLRKLRDLGTEGAKE